MLGGFWLEKRIKTLEFEPKCVIFEPNYTFFERNCRFFEPKMTMQTALATFLTLEWLR